VERSLELAARRLPNAKDGGTGSLIVRHRQAPAGDTMKTAVDLFDDIDRLGEQIVVQMDSLEASRRELDKVIESHPAKDVLRRISATLDCTTASLRELFQALWFRTAGLRRLVSGNEKTT